jgi:hypothetical protein
LLDYFIQLNLSDAIFAVNWGYNTPKEREEASDISRVKVIDLSDFSRNLK